MKKQPVLVLSLAIFILIISGGYFYYRYEKKIIRQEQYSNLKTIADLKINQILEWRKERLADAKVISEGTFIRQNLHRWLYSQDSTLEKGLLERFSLLKFNNKYEDVIVISAEGKFLLNLSSNLKYIDSETIDYCKKALQDKNVFMSDFYFSRSHDTIHIDIFAPIINDRNVAVAVLVLRVNPYDYLYPLIQSWPTSSKSAETLIIRRDGDSVLFQNELRHISNTALKLRIPLTHTDVPAVHAVLGQTGIFEGLDYRGVKVLSDIRPVPGTPWFMIAKVDQNEIFSELRYRTVIIMIITLLLLLFSGIGISLLYNNRQKNIYRKLLETGMALEESQIEFRTTLYSIGDAVITTDTKGCIRNMNVVAENLTGWKEPDGVGRNIGDVFNIVNEESGDRVESPVQRVLKEGLVVGLANHTLLISKDGKEIPIADSGAPIRNEKGDITGVVLVFRDQTREREAQKVLQESERKFRETLKYLDEGYYSCMMDGIILEHNRAFNRILGIDISKDMKGSKLPDFWLNPDERNAYLQELMTRGSIMNYQINVKTISGEKVVVLVNAHLVKDESGDPVRIEGTFTDFTKLKQAEETIRKSEARLRAILDATPFPIAIVDVQDNKIDFWSNSALTIFGHTAPTTTEWYQLAYPDPDYRNEVIARWKPFLEKARLTRQVVNTGEYRVTCLDGSVRICELHAAFIADDLIVIFNDITENKQAEQELIKAREKVEESEAKFRSLFNRVADAIFIFDPETFIITEANEATSKMYGYGKDEIIGMSCLKFSAEVDKSKAVAKNIERKGEEMVPLRHHKKKDGTDLFLKLQVSNIVVNKQPITFSVCHDITEIIKSKQDLEAAKEKAEESEAKLSTLFATMSEMVALHELVFDENGKPANYRITDCNDAFTRITGISRNAAVGGLSTDVYGTEQPPYLREYTAVALTGEPYHYETYFEPMDKHFSISVISPEKNLFATITTDITESKRTEKLLKESEAKFRQTFEFSPLGVVMVGLDKRFINCNDVFSHWLGYLAEEVIGKTIDDLTFPEDRNLGMAEMRAVSKGELEVSHVQKRYLHKDGIAVWGEVTISLVRNQKGNSQYFLAIIQDITERKLTEEKLKENLALLRIAGEKAKLGGWSVNLEGNSSYWSDEVAAIHGMPAGYSPTVEDGIKFYAPEWHDRITNVFSNCATNGIPYDEEMEIITANGKRIWIRTIGEAVMDSNGIICKVHGAFQDISERKQAERALRLKNFVFDASLAANSISDLNGLITEVNEAFLKIWGYTNKNEVIGKPLSEFIFNPEDTNSILLALQGSGEWVGNYPAKKKDGSTFIAYSFATVVKDESGSTIGYQSAVLDVTEEKQVKEEINKLNKELEQRVIQRTAQLETSNKELEAFSYSVSHDLRAPLRHVSGFVELLHKHFQSDLPEKGQHYLNSISDSARIMGMLIDDLLQFSRTGRMEMHQSDCDMNEIVKEVKESLTKDNPDREIEWVERKLPSVYGDKAMLRLVWTNLLSNAVKFTSTRKKARIEIGVLKENKELVFFVRDNGVGFDMHYVQKLFGVFQRLHPTEEFEGTGIGLANVQRIVSRHGGRAWAEAEPDKGAAFYFSIPNK